MKERSRFKDWFSKPAETAGQPEPAPAPAEMPNHPLPAESEAAVPLDRGLDEMRAQMARCLAQLEQIDLQLQEQRRSSTVQQEASDREQERLSRQADRLRLDDERLQREQDRLRAEEDRLRREDERRRGEEDRLRQEADALRTHLRQAENVVAERDQLIESLTRRIESQEAQLAAAGTSEQQLQAALAAEQQARHVHVSSKAAAYQELRSAFAAAVQRALPEHATVLVVSKGDDRLLELDGRRAWHFPRAEDGKYWGYHPVDSAAAIAHLEALRTQGAQYLVFPATAAWWLDHYTELRQHLEQHYTSVPSLDDSCIIFALGSGASPAAAGGRNPYREIEVAVETFRGTFQRWPAILDWNSGLQLAGQSGHLGAFSPPSTGATLPYLDGTIDMVVCGSSAAEIEEARRVSHGAIVSVEQAAVPNGANGHAAVPGVSIEWVTGAAASAIDASIIIPCFNAIEITEACLTAVLATLPREFDGEIIVFDDASTDDTRNRLKAWSKRDRRIRVKWRDANGGFIEACNRAAKAATRDYLVFLNNDTEPCRGWLTALLDTFRRFPDAGAVGGKLVLPDGTLQEAGGVIFRDGSAQHFMRRETNLDSPAINYVRSVDYCSGALLATPRQLFNALGGFDRRYKPAYYEDVDYCFKIRQAGRSVYYQPASKVIHREGASCGTDLTRGVKRYQVRNQRIFATQWKDILTGQPLRPAEAS
jgi:GT2 family glycosyltransferase